nr:MAG TPA: hypothetical protein [Caudoviricetes sp.]
MLKSRFYCCNLLINSVCFLMWWRVERDLKNQLSARIRRYFKNISQPKGQQKRYFLHFFGSINPASFISSQSWIS